MTLKRSLCRWATTFLLTIENIDQFLHDFSVEGLDIFVENPASQISVVGFSADQLGSFAFICTLHGHRDEEWKESSASKVSKFPSDGSEWQT
ncbi:MAG: hypothetical protein ACE1ZC_02150 [Nitrososphaerales archaeon]|nr:hypothetical protein [Nitrososphaerota archaeon]